MRGSTAQPAAENLVMKVEKGRVTLEKVKDGEDGPFFDFELEAVEIGVDADGEKATTCVVHKTAPSTTRAAKGFSEPVSPEDFEHAFNVVAANEAGVETASVAVVKAAYYEGREGTPNAKKVAWSRACSKAKASGVYAFTKTSISKKP